jgi:hypothetical protein
MNQLANWLARGAFLCLIAALAVFFGGLQSGGLHNSNAFVKWTLGLLVVSALAGLFSIRKSAAGLLGAATAAVSLYLIYYLMHDLGLAAEI